MSVIIKLAISKVCKVKTQCYHNGKGGDCRESYPKAEVVFLLCTFSVYGHVYDCSHKGNQVSRSMLLLIKDNVQNYWKFHLVTPGNLGTT